MGPYRVNHFSMKYLAAGRAKTTNEEEGGLVIVASGAVLHHSYVKVSLKGLPCSPVDAYVRRNAADNDRVDVEGFQKEF
jgi:hypothetical protein